MARPRITVRALAPFLLIAAAAMLPRLPALRGDAEPIWHDRTVLVEDTRMRSLGSIPGHFATVEWRGPPEVAFYRPVTRAVLTAERAVFGPDRVSLHRGVGLGLHVASCLLLFFLARRIVPGRPVVPILVAALFAEHPAATEVVAQVSARGTGLATVLSLGALLLALRETPRALLAAAALSLLAVLAHPVAVVVPAVFLLLREPAGGVTGFRRFVPVLLLAVPVVAAIVLRWGMTGAPGPVGDGVVLAERGFVDRALLAPGLLVRSFVAIVLPVSLTGDYGPDPAWTATAWSPPGLYLLSGILVLLVVAWLLFQRPRRPERIGLLGAALFLLPVLQLVPMDALTADRFLYLPAAFFALAGASAIDRLAGGVTGATPRARAVGVGVGLLLGCFAALGLARNPAYGDDGAFHRHVLDRFPTEEDGPRWRPGGLADVTVRQGAFHERRGDVERAADLYARAVELDPGRGEAQLRLGRLQLKAGRLEEAEVTLNKALYRATTTRASHRHRSRIRCELGVTAIRQEERRSRTRERIRGDRIHLAQIHLNHAVQLWPEHARAKYWLGVVLVRWQGHPEEGRQLLREAVALDPDLEPLTRKWMVWPRPLR